MVFRSLMLHRNLTRVADELGLTQPAISQALKKLREHYNDELFVRIANRMEPTRSALEIFDPINKALDEIFSTFSTAVDPKSIKYDLRLGFVEYASVFFLPILEQKFLKIAPGIKIVAEEMNSQTAVELFQTDRLDLVIGDLLEGWTGANRFALFREPYVVITGSRHPACDLTLSKHEFSRLEHIQLPIYRRVKGYLSQIGVELNYAAQTSNVMSVPSMISSSHLVAVVPKTFADVFKQLHDIREIRIAFDLPEVIVDMAFSGAKTSDPEFGWISQCISEIGAEIRDKLAAKAATSWKVH
ncbi:LysR family transcriptional regulator [Mesorhizobium sp. L-8-10]|uniref:LysR family transcriptional regulator n=1 Tax=Mesorhizobium sp. L-8-10 TaxID=2744523 RepID=UPI00192854E5|nr:LysR family transcriptional regulator [Mesorhizobium sp. L-8-10]